MQRSLKKEIVDTHTIERETLRVVLKHIGRTNQLFLLNFLLCIFIRRNRPSKSFTLLDVGAGGGSTTANISRNLNRKYDVRVTGIDTNPTAVEIAKSQFPHRPDVEFLPIPLAHLKTKYDMSFSTLVLHHLDPNDAVKFFRELKKHTKGAIIIADFIRSPLNHWLAMKVLAKMKAPDINRHDGPLSIRRAYSTHEIRDILWQAGIYVEPKIYNFLLWKFVIIPGTNHT